jgi:hypothetical protein
MAKKKKAIELNSFGGTKELGKVEMHGHKHEMVTAEVQSKRSIEEDIGEGREVILRQFTFGMNLQTFKEVRPNKQMIFNSHLRGIEAALWRDGMKIMPEVEPRISFDVEKAQYSIFVTARPMKGHLVTQTPQTLSQIAHGI